MARSKKIAKENVSISKMLELGSVNFYGNMKIPRERDADPDKTEDEYYTYEKMLGEFPE